MEQTTNGATKHAGKVGFLFRMGHGHATQFDNFRECAPEPLQERSSWIALYGEGSADLLANARWLSPKLRYGRHVLSHAKGGLARQHWQALFIAADQLNFSSIARRYPSYFYTDLSPSLKRELSPWYNHQLKNPTLTRLQTMLYSRMFQSGCGVFTMSEWAAKGVRRDYHLQPECVHVALPGANLRRWHFVDRSNRSSDRPIRILMVGGEFALKGGNLLLDWAERTSLKNWELDIVTWPSKLPDWVKACLGNPGMETTVYGSLAPRLPNVRVHCGLRANTLPLMELFEQADIFCLPTQADGSSIASLEAMACGLPVLVGAVGGIPELIQEGVTGMLTRRSDGQDLQVRLEALIEDAGLRLSLGRAARAECERFYNVERQMEQIFTVIDRECR